MEERNREVWIGESRLYLDEDDVVHVAAVGEIDEKTAIAMKEATLRFRSMSEGKSHVLADFSRPGKHSPEARRIWKEMMEDDKTGKVAVYGMNPVARVVASFVMGATRKKDVRFFKTKEEALGWLKEGE